MAGEEYFEEEIAAEEESKTKEEIVISQRHEDLRELLRLPSARRYLWWILELCHVYKSNFDHDAGVMAFREGERNIGLQILDDISSGAPKRFLELMKERSDDTART